MTKSSWSSVKANSWQYAKDIDIARQSLEAQKIHEKVNKNFCDFKRIKWFFVMSGNSSKKYRKGAQNFLN